MTSNTEAPTSGAGLSEAKRALLERLRSGSAAPTAPRIPKAPEGIPIRLSLAQERIWLMSQLAGDVPAFNLVAAARITRAVDTDVLRTNVDRACRRNDSMRMSVHLVDGAPHLRVDDDVEVHVELSHVGDADDPTAAATARVRTFAERRYDLLAGPLWRVELIRLGPDDHMLALGAHHLVCDGDSLSLVMQEIATGHALGNVTVDYIDFAAHEHEQDRRGVFDAGLAHWSERLADPPEPLDLPADRPPRSSPDYAGATIQRDLGVATGSRLARLGTQQGVTVFAVLFAAYAALLGRLARAGDLLIGTPVTRRSMPELENLVGLLINILPIRVTLRPGETFRELVTRIGPMLAADQEHAEVPYERIVRAMRRPAGGRPLVQVGFNMPAQRALAMPGQQLGPAQGEDVVPTPMTPAGSQLELTVHILTRPDGSATVQLEYAAARFDEDTAHDLISRYVHLLEHVARNPDRPVEAVGLLEAGERERVLRLGSGPWVPPRPLLPEVIARRIESDADRVAVEDGDHRCTYAELGARTGVLASRLAAAGVRHGDVVALCMARGVALPAAVLATWRVGAAFLPLDVDHPPSRWKAIAGTARPVAVITDRPDDVRSADLAGATVIDLATGSAGRAPSAAPLRGDDVAYVMFTSGSTGAPKGVLVGHDAIANRVCWTLDHQRLGPTDRVLAKTRVGFDAAVLEWTAPLAAGGVVVLAAPGIERDPAALVHALDTTRATVVQTVPSVLRLMVEEAAWPDDDALRQVWLAGEPLDGRLVRRLRDRTGAAVWNTYGPTECAIDVSGSELLARHADANVLPDGPLTIGRPFDGVHVIVADAGGEPAPIGAPGDLLVGGVAVSQGYADRPDLTADRFVPDPFGRPGARLYRTGDLARWRADGALEFLGRIDDQVKINGVRTEPAEVAAALTGIPGVHGAHVAAWSGRSSTARLVAYVTADDGLEAADLRLRAAERLPDTMVPSQFVVLDALPLNDNGKVDRRALPSPDAGALRPEHTPPRSATERAVAEVWQDVLDIRRVGVHDDFFAVGGHSLLLTRVQHGLAERLDRPVPLRLLFDVTTVEGVAAALDDDTATETDAISSVPRDRPLPLSFSQTRWWFQERLHIGGLDHAIPLFIPLAEGTADHTVRATLTALVARHEVLRTRYEEHSGFPSQIIDPAGPAQLATAEVAEADVEECVLAEWRRPFDLAHGPVWRALLLRTPASDPLLMITMHHIASDGWSSAVLRDEFTAVHDHIVRTGAPLSRPAPVQYADYAAWQRRRFDADESISDLVFWRTTLADLPVLELPTDRPRRTIHDPHGARVTRRIPVQVTSAILALGRERGASPFMTFLTGLVALLSRYTGQADIAVGTPVAGRPRPELTDAVGCFINTLVLRCDLTDDPTFGVLLDRVRSTTLDAFAHQEVPFERLVEDLAPDRDMSRFPLFSVQFDVQDVAHAGDTLEEQAGGVPAVVRQDLAVTLRLEDDGSTSVVVRYPVALFDHATVERVVDHLERLLEEAVAGPATRVTALPLSDPTTVADRDGAPEALRRAPLFRDPRPATGTDAGGDDAGPDDVDLDLAAAVLLDGAMCPAPDGVVGDLYLRGPTPPRDWWRDPAATAGRLVPDPTGPPGSRMLRTGGRARRIGGRIARIVPGAVRTDTVRPTGTDRRAVVAPQTQVQERLADRWSELLEIERPRVGIHHSFFQVGGHSLLAVRLIAHIAEDFDVTLPLRTVFEAPTIAGLAAEIEEVVEAEIAGLSDDEVSAALHDRQG